MAKKLYKALEPLTLDKEIRPGDTFEAEPSDVEGKDVVELGAGSSGPVAPTGEAERMAAIVEAIGTLDKKDAALWTSGGAPKAEAITAVTGWSVSGKERDAAWAQINK
jgi:hypothetical protein